MKLSPTEIFKGKKIFFIGGTGRSADTPVRIAGSPGEVFFVLRTHADKSVRAPL